MKNFRTNIIAILVAFCFSFVAFAVQPAEAMSHKAKAGISTPAKQKKAVKQTKIAKKSNKAKKAKTATKVKSAKKPSIETKRPVLSEDPAAQ
jgi:hypothetical protein